jgi:hypothetical protein
MVIMVIKRIRRYTIITSNFLITGVDATQGGIGSVPSWCSTTCMLSRACA